ncbi:MAG TPA: methyltransferase domain-containing protein, partial [Ktedonobacterales bacterium]|nr:methyltransferase domain-containing protein [Ktedonobacterales bacterium]
APGREDIEWFEDGAARYAPPGARALLLGVTAGIATMRWPASTKLAAIDWSPGMLRNVWPARGTPDGTGVVCADWRELPLAGACVDLIVGDGCYTALGNVADAALLNLEMRRALRPGGTVLMRCFCRPAAGLEIDSLFAQLFAQPIRNLDLFRWLLAMAVHGESLAGVSLRAVWEVWARRVPDARALQQQMQWSDAAVQNMEKMATATMVYSFPTLDELLQIARPDFDLVERDTPDYAWGDLFPRVVLRSR